MSLLRIFGSKKAPAATNVVEAPYVPKNTPPPGFVRLSKPEGADDKDLCGDYNGWICPPDPDCTICFYGGYMKVDNDIQVCACRRADDKVRASTAAASAAAESHKLSMSKGSKS